MPFHIPAWIPPTRGLRLGLGALATEMPLVRGGGLHQLETALWLPTHRHEHWELHYLHRGRLDVELPERGRELGTRGGWFVLTAPGRAHRARDGIMSPNHLVWLSLDPLHADATRGTPFTRADLRRLHGVLRGRADSSWPAPAAASDAFRRLRDQLASSSPFAAAGVRAAVAELLILACAALAAEEPAPALARALVALADDPRRPCTVGAAAARAGISAARLHALCVRHLGTTPAAWQLAQRLAVARQRLAAGATVGAVATELGFSSPRYFAYAFRREVGVPPSRYAEIRTLARTAPVLRW